MLHDPLITRLTARFERTERFDWPGEFPLSTTQQPAAVLIPIALGATGPGVLLTRRAEHLHHHPGQISFPGGRLEPSDHNAVAAALRESEEEIGLAPSQVRVLGSLPDYASSSGFRITPVVGLVAPGFVPRLDPFEVAELFSVPLDFVLNPSHYQQHRVQHRLGVRHFHAIPHRGRFIWGVTAGILAMLTAFVGQNGN